MLNSKIFKIYVVSKILWARDNLKNHVRVESSGTPIFVRNWTVQSRLELLQQNLFLRSLLFARKINFVNP